MPRISGTAWPLALLLLIGNAGLVLADETRTPTPEEFREQVRQYRESGRIPGERPRAAAPRVPKAIEQFERAMSLHMKKEATPAELKEAASLYQAASDAGLPQASTNLAFLYLEGKGVKKDVRKAVSLLNIASKKNIPQADMALARLYLVGKDVKRDEKKGELHLNKAARTGDRNAIKMLAEYKDWKKKNELATKQYQEILKNARINMEKPASSFQPAMGGYPFPVIPGQAYLEMNQAAAPPAKNQTPPLAHTEQTGAKENAGTPVPVEVHTPTGTAAEKPATQASPGPAAGPQAPATPQK